MAMNFDPMTGEPINPVPAPQSGNPAPQSGNPTPQSDNQAPQMNFDPMTGQPVNPIPTPAQPQPQPQMYFDPMTGMPMQQVPVKKKKTGLIVGIVAAVVVVAGAGTVFAGVKSGFFLSKSNKVLLATANTFSESSHVTEALTGLEVVNSDAYTLDISGEAEDYSLQATYAQKSDEKQISGKVKGDGFSDVEFLAGIDKNEIKLSAPLLGDKVYTYNYNEKKSGYLVDSVGEDNIATIDKLCQQVFSDKEQKKNAKELTKKYADQYKKLDFSSAEKASFEVDGKEHKCAGYQTTITSDYMIESVDIFEDYMDDQMGDMLDQAVITKEAYDDYKESFDELKDAFREMPDMDVTFYIYKNKLACVQAIDSSDKEDNIQLLFKGGDRRTQNMEVLIAGDSVMKVSGDIEENKEVSRLWVDDQSVCELSYDFKSGDYTLDITGAGSVTGTLQSDRKGLQLSAEGAGLRISLDLKKGAELQKFSGDEFDIGNASEQEFQSLIQEIYGISGSDSDYGDDYDDYDSGYDDYNDYDSDYDEYNSNYDDYDYDNYDEDDEL